MRVRRITDNSVMNNFFLEIRGNSKRFFKEVQNYQKMKYDMKSKESLRMLLQHLFYMQ